MSPKKEAVVRFYETITRPLARIAIRFGASAQEAADITRWSFVRSFYETPEFWRNGRPTAVQCAVKTGIARAEAKRLTGLPAPHGTLLPQRQSRSARVIEGWLNDPDFQNDGEPASLPVKSASPPSFNRLCRRYAGDVDTASIIDDLRDSGCVEVKSGLVELVSPVYGLDLPEDGRLDITAYMVSRLLETGEHNLLEISPDKRRLKRYWRQRLIPQDHVKEARRFLFELSVECGRRIDRRLVELSHVERKQGVEYVDMGIAMFMFEGEGDDLLDVEQEFHNEQGG